MPSARQKILEDFQTKLAEIQVANGYETDIGSNLYYWNDLDFEFGERALEFRDTFEETVTANIPYKKELSIVVRAFEPTENVLIRGSQVLADLEKAIDQFRGAVKNGQVLLVGNEKAVETKGKKLLKISVRVKIFYQDETGGGAW